MKLFLSILDSAFDKPSWHGPNLMSSLRGLRAADAAWAPVGRKSIWEQALHAAYWKQRVLNRLSGVKRGERFPRRPSNWPRLPERITERAWREDVQLLVDIHTK